LPIGKESLTKSQKFFPLELRAKTQGTDPLQQFVGGIYDFGLDDFSILNFYNGEMGGFSIYDQAKATFSGGRIDYISSYQYTGSTSPTIPGGHITFIADLDSIALTGNLLTGDWLNDGGSFSITLQDQTGYDPVYSNINFIPEPATLLLFGFGSLLLRKKR